MFRRRLQLAPCPLAFAAAIQGAVAWWAVDFASTKVLRGRVASDLHTGFIDLLASKQRLFDTSQGQDMRAVLAGNIARGLGWRLDEKA